MLNKSINLFRYSMNSELLVICLTKEIVFSNQILYRSLIIQMLSLVSVSNYKLS